MKRFVPIAIALVGLSCLGMCALSIWVRPKNYVTPDQTLLYSEPSGEKLYIDVYRPDETKSLHRAIMLIHGGGWAAGDKKDMGDFARVLNAKGYTCFAVQYRFAPKYVWPAQLDDVQTAVRWVRAHASEYKIDKNYIGAVGGSAGGHLVQCLGVRDTRDPQPKEYGKFSSRVQAVWNIFGPTDFTQTYPDVTKGIIKSFLGELTQAKLKDASPIFFVDERSAPTFFLQGKKDELVPWTQAELMANKLKKARIPVELNLIEDMGHSPDMKNPEVAKAMQRGIDWLQETLFKVMVGQPAGVGPK